MESLHRWITIQGYKHDGSLHRVWDRAYILHDDEDFIITATRRTKVIEADGRRWFTHEPAITIFSKKDWYNVIAMLKETGVCYYCNIASPTVVDQGKIKYIDYDLDLKLFPDGNIRVLDEREYENHRKKYGYSDRLDRVLKYEVEKIRKMMEENQFPFQDEWIKQQYHRFQMEEGL